MLPDWTSEPLALNLLYPRSRQLPARVRVFIEWAAQLYSREETLARAALK